MTPTPAESPARLTTLRRVRRASQARDRAQEQYVMSLRAALHAGHSIYEIAEAAQTTVKKLRSEFGVFIS